MGSLNSVPTLSGQTDHLQHTIKVLNKTNFNTCCKLLNDDFHEKHIQMSRIK